MIEQGTDGLSRGELFEGSMRGSRFATYVPLHKSALERSSLLVKWLKGWIPHPSPLFLDIEDWFEKGQGVEGGGCNLDGIWMPEESGVEWMIWAPPPAIADVALDELELSRHKRKQINHVFEVPRLMTHIWRKRLKRLCDLVFELPPGTRDVWPALEHEPLIIGLTLRFLLSSPWQTRRSDGILEVERQLRQVWETQGGDEGHILCEFCLTPSRMGPM